MKKLATFLASIFLAGIFTANAAILPTSFTPDPFTDVDDSTSYSNSIEWMKNNKIVSGYDDGSFGVDKCVNRVEFLKIMYKVQGVEIPSEPSTSSVTLFKDTPANAWYIPYLKVAKEQGIVKGYPDNTFHPAQCIARSEAAKIATLSFNNNTMPENPTSTIYSGSSYYSDIKAGSWYYPYMDYALKANTLGTDHTIGTYDYNTGTSKFDPSDPMTRKEAAEMFYRYKTISDRQLEEYMYGEKPLIKEADLFYNNCSIDLSLPEGLDIEIENNILSALPKDSSIVVGADHSDETQLKNVEKILSTLTKQDFWEEISAELTDLDLIINSDWKVAAGLTMNAANNDVSEVVLIGEFENANEFEEIFGQMAADEMNYSTTCEKSGGITYWTSIDAEFYLAKVGKFFIVTNTEAARKQAIEGLTSGVGFSFSNNLDNDKLAYLYINKDLVTTLAAELENEIDPVLTQLVGTLDSIGDVYGYIKADSEGFLTSLEAKVKDATDPLIKNYIGTSPSLVSKVPGENTLIYGEDIDLSLIFQAMSTSAYSTYDDTLTEMATELGTTNEELDDFLSSPYAFSMAYNESFIPSISFYLQFESSDSPTADKVITALDKIIDEIIAEESMGGDVQLSDVATKSTTSSGLTKVTLNVSDLPATSTEETKMKASLEKSGVELYYGILDDTLVIALYPSFEQYYNSDPLSQNTTYKQAVGKLNGVYGGKISYINITNIIDYLEIIMDLNSDSYLISEDEIATVKELVGIFKYLISSTEVTRSSIMMSSYLRMGN